MSAVMLTHCAWPTPVADITAILSGHLNAAGLGLGEGKGDGEGLGDGDAAGEGTAEGEGLGCAGCPQPATTRAAATINARAARNMFCLFI